MNCGADEQTVGEHSAQLKSLKEDQKDIVESISEVKSDLKELINLIKSALEKNQTDLQVKVEKLENKIDMIVWNVIKGVGVIGFSLAAWYFSQTSTHIFGK